MRTALFKKVHPHKAGIVVTIFLLCLVFFTAGAFAAETPKDAPFTVADTVKQALAVNLDLKVSTEGIRAADAARKSSRAGFFPTFSATYQSVHNYEEYRSPYFPGVVSIPRNQNTFVATLTQTIFAGFAVKNQYEIAKLGLDMAKYDERRVRHLVIYDAKSTYFQLLKTRKLLGVADQTVKQITAQKEVARNFYEVGMSPRNDLLQAQVELANAIQARVVAENNLTIAEANFNTLLRRPLDMPVKVEDITDYEHLALTLEECLVSAANRRPELVIAEANVAIAGGQVKLSKKNFYPTVALKYNNYQMGTDYGLNGGEGISDPSSWNITATATWQLWSSGADYYSVRESLSKLKQAKDQQQALKDGINLEVKQAFLRTRQAEQNIATAATAIEQAEENFRINEERYKEQVATSTDVLNAQTLLTRTQVSYYNALYDYKIAKAALLKAIGAEDES